MGPKKNMQKNSRQKVARTCRKHCDNYPAVVCSEGGPPDWGTDGLRLGSPILCGKKADQFCVEKRRVNGNCLVGSPEW